MASFCTGFILIMVMEAVAHAMMRSAVSPAAADALTTTRAKRHTDTDSGSDPSVNSPATPSSATALMAEPSAAPHKPWQTCTSSGTRLCTCGSWCSRAALGAGAAAASLSLHSIIAGIGMGATQDTGQQADLLLAVLAHKGLAAFSLALLASTLRPRLRALLLGIFTLSTPLGICIGMGIASAAEDTAVIPLVIAFASGTILYTGAFEIVQPELVPEAASGEEGGHEGLLIAALAPMAASTPRLPHWSGVGDAYVPLAGRPRSASAGHSPGALPLTHQDIADSSALAPSAGGEGTVPPPPCSTHVHPPLWHLAVKVASMCAGFAGMSSLALWV